MHLIDRILKNQFGMTMMEMVVAGGIAGAAAMGAASLMGGMSGSSRDAELVIEKTQFASSLGVYLNSTFGCTDLKTAVVSGANFTIDDQEIKLDQWKYVRFTTLLLDSLAITSALNCLSTSPFVLSTPLDSCTSITRYLTSNHAFNCFTVSLRNSKPALLLFHHVSQKYAYT